MSKATLTPIAGSGNRVFIEPVTEAVYESAGGILIGKQLNKTTAEGQIIDESRPNEGIVTAVSEKDANGVAPQVKVGNKVLFAPFAGIDATFRDKTFRVLKESDIQAIINEG